MKGFFEIEALSEVTTEKVSFPTLLSVKEVVSVLDLTPELARDPTLTPAIGAKTCIILKSKTNPVYTSADFDLVRRLMETAQR